MHRLFSLALACCLGLAAADASAWSLAKEDGAWWLKDSSGRRFLSRGVNTVNGGQDTPKARSSQAYYWQRFGGDETACLRRAESRLTDWGFNTLGGMSDDSDHGGAMTMPFIVTLYLGSWAEMHWTDPFDPAMAERVRREADRLLAPIKDNPRLLGCFTDNEIGWWNSPIFGFYLRQGWERHTKRVLWNLLHETYGGDWSRLLVDFVPAAGLDDWEALKAAGAQLKLRPGGQGIALVNRFTYLVARRYYSLVYDAVKRAAPNVLVMGDRLPLYYNQSAALAMREHVDVVSTNYNVDVQDGWVAPYYFEGLERLTGRPVLVSEYFFAARENQSGNANNGHLMTVDTQAERAQGAAESMRQFSRFPNVVGVHWFQYYDEPQGGRETDGEDFNFGLVDIHDRPYDLLTDSLKAANAETEAIHAQAGRDRVAPGAAEANGLPRPGKNQAARSARPGARLLLAGSRNGETATAVPVRRAAATDTAVIRRAVRPISVRDDSLTDWDKAATRLTGFHTPAPFVPFGDAHLAWAPEGLYLSGIAQNYLDWRLLSFDGTTFPLSEVFQVHLRLDGPGGPRHYAVCLMPEISARYKDSHAARLEIRPKVFRFDDADPANPRLENPRPDNPREEEGVVARQISKPLPHIAFEAFFPAKALGFTALKPGIELKINVWATNYYRELTMTWAESVEARKMVRLAGDPPPNERREPRASRR